MVCLQHEYGIFGGVAGSHILHLLRALKMPVVTTLHTVLREPNPDQLAVMEEIAELSDRLIVMRDGRIAAELTPDQFSMETVFAHAAGLEPRPERGALH